MYAVIGLGNPGAQYQHTRHNLGFWAVEALASQLGLSTSFKRKGGCEIERGQLGSEQVVLILPQTYMNRSGEAAQPILGYFKIPVDHVIVIHDELDLDPGALRVKVGGGAGGHNGLRDLIEKLGSPDFYRIRIGVGHPRRAGLPQMDPSDYVLGHPGKDEAALLREVAADAARAAAALITDGLAAAQQQYHRRPAVKNA
ncbi:MAG: aminoacyl-tRNA hydrolase [Bdellovibrionota bacterium]